MNRDTGAAASGSSASRTRARTGNQPAPRKAKRRNGKGRNTPLSQPYLVTAPPSVTAPPPDIDRNLILPSTYVRSLTSSPKPQRPPNHTRTSSGSLPLPSSPGPSRQGYGANLLSPPAIMPAAVSAQRASPSPTPPSRGGYAANLLSPPLIMPGGRSAEPLMAHFTPMTRPQGPLERTARLGSSGNNSQLSLGRPVSPAVDDGAHRPTGSQQRRPRRRVVQESIRRRRRAETVSTVEEGRAVGLSRGASMRRVNVWDDLPPDEEPPPPFPFQTRSNVRQPPTFTQSEDGHSLDGENPSLPSIPDSPPPPFEVAMAVPGVDARLTASSSTNRRPVSPTTTAAYVSAPSSPVSEESDGLFAIDEDDSSRLDRRLWNADILAGYTLEERVRRETARRRTRLEEAEAAFLAQQGDVYQSLQGEDAAATPTAELEVATPTAEVEGGLPSHSATPTAEMEVATPTGQLGAAPLSDSANCAEHAGLEVTATALQKATASSSLWETTSTGPLQDSQLKDIAEASDDVTTTPPRSPTMEIPVHDSPNLQYGSTDDLTVAPPTPSGIEVHEDPGWCALSGTHPLNAERLSGETPIETSTAKSLPLPSRSFAATSWNISEAEGPPVRAADKDPLAAPSSTPSAEATEIATRRAEVAAAATRRFEVDAAIRRASSSRPVSIEEHDAVARKALNILHGRSASSEDIRSVVKEAISAVHSRRNSQERAPAPTEVPPAVVSSPLFSSPAKPLSILPIASESPLLRSNSGDVAPSDEDEYTLKPVAASNEYSTGELTETTLRAKTVSSDSPALPATHCASQLSPATLNKTLPARSPTSSPTTSCSSSTSSVVRNAAPLPTSPTSDGVSSDHQQEDNAVTETHSRHSPSLPPSSRRGSGASVVSGGSMSYPKAKRTSSVSGPRRMPLTRQYSSKSNMHGAPPTSGQRLKSSPVSSPESVGDIHRNAMTPPPVQTETSYPVQSPTASSVGSADMRPTTVEWMPNSAEQPPNFNSANSSVAEVSRVAAERVLPQPPSEAVSASQGAQHERSRRSESTSALSRPDKTVEEATSATRKPYLHVPMVPATKASKTLSPVVELSPGPISPANADASPTIPMSQRDFRTNRQSIRISSAGILKERPRQESSHASRRLSEECYLSPETSGLHKNHVFSSVGADNGDAVPRMPGETGEDVASDDSDVGKPETTQDGKTGSVTNGDTWQDSVGESPGLNTLVDTSSALLRLLEAQINSGAESSAQGAARAAARSVLADEIQRQRDIERGIEVSKQALVQSDSDHALALRLQAEDEAERLRVEAASTNDHELAAALEAEQRAHEDHALALALQEDDSESDKDPSISEWPLPADPSEMPSSNVARGKRRAPPPPPPKPRRPPPPPPPLSPPSDVDGSPRSRGTHHDIGEHVSYLPPKSPPSRSQSRSGVITRKSYQAPIITFSGASRPMSIATVSERAETAQGSPPNTNTEHNGLPSSRSPPPPSSPLAQQAPLENLSLPPDEAQAMLGHFPAPPSSFTPPVSSSTAVAGPAAGRLRPNGAQLVSFEKQSRSYADATPAENFSIPMDEAKEMLSTFPIPPLASRTSAPSHVPQLPPLRQARPLSQLPPRAPPPLPPGPPGRLRRAPPPKPTRAVPPVPTEVSVMSPKSEVEPLYRTNANQVRPTSSREVPPSSQDQFSSRYVPFPSQDSSSSSLSDHREQQPRPALNGTPNTTPLDQHFEEPLNTRSPAPPPLVRRLSALPSVRPRGPRSQRSTPPPVPPRPWARVAGHSPSPSRLRTGLNSEAEMPRNTSATPPLWPQPELVGSPSSAADSSSSSLFSPSRPLEQGQVALPGPESAQSEVLFPRTEGVQTSAFAADPRLSPANSQRSGSTPPPPDNSFPEQEITDVDLYASRLEGADNEYEGLNRIIDFLGPVRQPGATPEMLSTLIEAPVTVDSRRVNAAGKVKIKLSVLGVRVTTCPVCLSQYRGDDRALLMPRCGHIAHANCARRWYRESDCCMVCREKLIHDDTDDDMTHAPLRQE